MPDSDEKNGDKNKILITGAPGIGKTTLIIRLSEKLKSLNPIGFFTSEIRKNNIRVGFELISPDGRKFIFSHVEIDSPLRVGKYGVDISAFENFLESTDFLNPACNLILIDEIGKMECFSIKFKHLIEDLLKGEKSLIATIALRGEGFIHEVKEHPRVKSFELTRRNRNTLSGDILELFGY